MKPRSEKEIAKINMGVLRLNKMQYAQFNVFMQTPPIDYPADLKTLLTETCRKYGYSGDVFAETVADYVRENWK